MRSPKPSKAKLKPSLMLHLGDEIRWEYTFVEEVQVVGGLGVFGSPVSTLHTSAVDGKATKLEL